jgi:hypothetical protein
MNLAHALAVILPDAALHLSRHSQPRAMLGLSLALSSSSHLRAFLRLPLQPLPSLQHFSAGALHRVHRKLPCVAAIRRPMTEQRVCSSKQWGLRTEESNVSFLPQHRLETNSNHLQPKACLRPSSPSTRTPAEYVFCYRNATESRAALVRFSHADTSSCCFSLQPNGWTVAFLLKYVVPAFTSVQLRSFLVIYFQPGDANPLASTGRLDSPTRPKC